MSEQETQTPEDKQRIHLEETKLTPKDTTIENLGPPTIPTPNMVSHYYSDSERVTIRSHFEDKQDLQDYASDPVCFEIAGPREMIYHNPDNTKAGIVTCGGLSPGLNNVIRALVMQLWYRYGIRDIFGFQYGYRGLNPHYWHEPIKLSPQVVDSIHYRGGSILGSSRGQQDPKTLVDTLVHFGINIFFPIGGDGTMRGARAIVEEIKRRKLKISVIGIPKTIDNDISYISKTFGFETAFSTAVQAIATASSEAEGAFNGIGLVKLMGRHSGYVTANAALSLKEVNFVLIPEVDFDLEGPNGFLAHLEKRLKRRHHAVIALAEGAGQKYVTPNATTKQDHDASGNLKLGDIGGYLKKKIKEYLEQIGLEHTLKYIDPSYIIRSQPANASDTIFAGHLAQHAVHAAMAGKTNMLVGTWNDHYTHVPIKLATSKRRIIKPETSPVWQSVLDSTGQPASMKNPG